MRDVRDGVGESGFGGRPGRAANIRYYDNEIHENNVGVSGWKKRRVYAGAPSFTVP